MRKSALAITSGRARPIAADGGRPPAVFAAEVREGSGDLRTVAARSDIARRDIAGWLSKWRREVR